jgi:predicted metal-binding membrane protein
MSAAMMLPSAAPMVLAYSSFSRSRRNATFVAGYLAVWTLFGLAAYGAYRLAADAELDWLHWEHGGPYVAGAALAAAGLYQLTPLKEVCLRHCRGPLHYLVRGWREGRLGALRMGAEHGLFCVGCCWGLMLALFALGVMSLFWTAVAAAVIFAEKVLPQGQRVTRVLAVALVALGLLVALSPSRVPALTEPAPMEMSP